jgi:hypothetical protein
MNRNERRARKENLPPLLIEVGIGRFLMNGEGKVTCFVCDNEAKDWPWPDAPQGPVRGYGLARLTCHCGCDAEPYDMPLCERCHGSDDVSNAVTRKLYGAPDFKFTEGGSYESVEQLKQDLETAMADTSSKRH